MITTAQVQTAINLVAQVQEKHLNRRSPFHLGPCGGCGLPAFQQPCSVCGHYPWYSQESRQPGPRLDTRMFCSSVERSAPDKANIGTWLAASYRKTLAPHLADRMLPDMQALDLPTAAEIAEYFAANPKTVNNTLESGLPF